MALAGAEPELRRELEALKAQMEQGRKQMEQDRQRIEQLERQLASQGCRGHARVPAVIPLRQG